MTRNNTIGKNLIILGSTDSTNNYAMGQVREGLAKHGDAYFAMEQTHGKGQRGREWHSAYGENIMVSIVFDMAEMQAADGIFFNMSVALAVYHFFYGLAGDETKIKWPNDLFWRDRKAGGILIENVIHGKDWQWAIAGMGININQASFNAAQANAVSLKQITGKTFDVIELTRRLCACLEKAWQQLLSGNFDDVFDEYNQLIYAVGKSCKLKRDNIVSEYLIKGVTRHGQLHAFNGMDHFFNAGDVEWQFI